LGGEATTRRARRAAPPQIPSRQSPVPRTGVVAAQNDRRAFREPVLSHHRCVTSVSGLSFRAKRGILGGEATTRRARRAAPPQIPSRQTLVPARAWSALRMTEGGAPSTLSLRERAGVRVNLPCRIISLHLRLNLHSPLCCLSSPFAASRVRMAASSNEGRLRQSFRNFAASGNFRSSSIVSEID